MNCNRAAGACSDLEQDQRSAQQAQKGSIMAIEELAPGVITVTEIEETQIPGGRDEREEC